MGQDQWRFAPSEGIPLRNHASTPIERHVKVKGNASPYDGNLLYWSKRLRSSHPLTQNRLGILLSRQQGKCRYCELLFRENDVIEMDHLTPRSQGGKDDISNLVALHRHCHDQRHAAEPGRGIHDKNHTTEELDELETLTSSSGGGQEGAIPLV